MWNACDLVQTEQEKNRIRDTFLELTSIDNPSLDERKMADHVLSILREMKIEAGEDDSWKLTGGNTGNLYAYLEGSPEYKGDAPGKPLLLSAHLDSVSPACGKHPLVHEDGVVTSDGTTVLGGDDLAGVTAILEALRSILQNGIPHRPVEVIFFAAEELYDVGSEQFDFSGIRSDEAYVLDASGKVGTYIKKAPTILSLEAVFEGKAAHAGFEPEKGIHSIKIAAEAVSSLPMGHIDGETTTNIGEIAGGTGTNIVPETCTVRGEVRSYSHEKALEQILRIREHFEKTAARFGAGLRWKERECMRAYEIFAGHPALLQFQKACDALKIPVCSQTSFGGSDNNQLAAHGVSGIVLSIGMKDVHSVHESISLEDIYQVTRICEALMIL